MNKFLLLILAGLFIFQSGCAKSIRYTHDEIRDFTPSIQERIKNGEISMGMSKLQVRYAWGGPDEEIVLEPAQSGKERVEWTYRRLSFFKTRLIFIDDRLAEIISGEPGIRK